MISTESMSSLTQSITQGAPAAGDFAPGIEAAFPAQFAEFDGKLECVAGQVPDFVRGTYYLNGPARFRIGDLPYRHWLDGDGMVSRMRIGGDGVHFKSRYVRSTKYVSEQDAGRAVFRTFGTSFLGSQLNAINNGLENPVNVSVYPFADRLLAFGEQGLPWEIDPDTLETRGQFTFNGRLNDASPMAAHPKFDPETGEMFNFGVFFSSRNPRLYFYCFGAEGMRFRSALPLPYACSVHDFILSKHYAIFYLAPYILDINSILQDGRTVMDSLSWEPERGSRLVVLERGNGQVVATLAVGCRYCLHLINAFEQDGRLNVDVLEFDAPIYSHYQPVPELFTNVPDGRPVRFIVDLETRQLRECVSVNYSQAPDFPVLDPRRTMQAYDDFWMLGISAAGTCGRKFFDQLVHARWGEQTPGDIYQCPTRRYLGGEPVFVAQPGSPNGVVICQEFDAQSGDTHFVLFEARNISAGPIARLALDRPIYLGFHAAFLPDPAPA
jgi:all-trans-8'-apo-beta-carotenal 15,15'-oxygenase